MYPLRKPVDIDALLAEVYAAELLGLSSRTLQAWRTKGIGPAFVRAGRAIRYRRRDLIAWMDANTVVSKKETTPAE
jgi:DNA-binding transcriptional MerR regulator